MWWLAPLPHSRGFYWFRSRLVSVWSLHVFPVYVWVLSGYSGFLLPLFKNMHVGLTGDSKLSLGVSVSSLYFYPLPEPGFGTGVADH